MKFELEKEMGWSNGKIIDRYWIKVDSYIVDMAYDEEKALELYEKAKANYVGSRKEIIRQEEI